jgi:hypothetical protein
MPRRSLPYIRIQPLGACRGDTLFRVTVIGEVCGGRLAISVPDEAMPPSWTPEARLQLVADMLAASDEEGASHLFGNLIAAGRAGLKVVVATDGMELRLVDGPDVASIVEAAMERAGAEQDAEPQSALARLG